MVDIEVVREWLTKADEDFAFAQVNLEEEKPFFAQICFHFHQAAEKYLKAYIIAHELDFRKVHDLILLLKICLANDVSFAQLRDDCDYLNTFYVETRYPVHWPTHFTRGEAQKASQAAENIRTLIKSKF
ncbi:MAG: HEPN domain-containing protein [Thermodesulfobacteriota bacterium]